MLKEVHLGFFSAVKCQNGEYLTITECLGQQDNKSQINVEIQITFNIQEKIQILIILNFRQAINTS